MSFKIEKDLTNWILGKIKYKNKIDERNIMSQYYNFKTNKQWTNKFGEDLVKYLLELQGYTVKSQPMIGNFRLDLETVDAIYEIKTRNYSTSGTAGEKIIGTPYKYCNMVQTKPLYIVVVGYQEKEATEKFELFNPKNNKLKMIEFWKDMDIHFVRCSDILYKSLYSLVLNEIKHHLD